MRILCSLVFTTALSACTLVEGDRILGRELAAENASFASIKGDADIGPAPAPGSRRTFQYYELDRIAKEHSIALASHEACFERATVLLTADLLRETVKGVEILDFSRNPLPVGKPEFLPDGLAATGLWRGRWLYGENRSVPIWVRVSGSGLAKRSVAPAIGRGDKVRVEVRSGGVLLAFEAEAENSGHTGERVTVRNPSNGQRFRALVEAPGKVSIKK
jgi:hypothetical protein